MRKLLVISFANRNQILGITNNLDVLGILYVVYVIRGCSTALEGPKTSMATNAHRILGQYKQS